MKYIRTYETEEGFLADKDSTSRGFRLKPVLYKYSEAGDHIHLELDDPRKHGDSTYIEITLNSDTEFSFYIGNKSGDTQTTMKCTIDWGDGTVETKTITTDDKGFKLSHNYVAGSYKIELYDVEREYGIPGDDTNYISYITSPHSSVKRIVLGGSVVDIGESAFNECKSLISVYIPESVVSVEIRAFIDCYGLTSINIPESVTSIGPKAFEDCISLTSIHIPSGVTSIKESTFWNCTSLKSIYIPESVNSIEYDVFGQCKSLASINIPSGVTSIERWTFLSCTSLTSIDIPENVTSIGKEAFKGCSTLSLISSLNTTAPLLSTDSDGVFANLPTNGTLHVKPGATGYDAWLSKLPSGWTIVEDL